MVGRITVVAVGVAGIAVAGLSVASATLWRPDDVLRASVTTDSPYVVTAAGVVEMGGQPTTVTVTTDDKKAPLVVAVGRDTDVAGWVGDDPHETISGMTGWSSLRVVGPTAGPTAEPEAQPAEDAPADGETSAGYVSPAGSDMWVAQATGDGRAELKGWSASAEYPGRWSVLVANSTGAQTTVELAWPRNVSTPWLIPGLIVGLGAVGWAAYVELRRRGILTFGARKAALVGVGGTDDADGGALPVRSRRGARAAHKSGQSGPVPVVAGPVDEPTEVSPTWGTAAFAPPAGEPTTVADAAWEATVVTPPAGGPTTVVDPALETAAFAPPIDGDPAQAPGPGRRERALPSWSPARTWQRARHSVEPDEPEPTFGATATRGQPTAAAPVVAPPGPGLVPPPPAPAGRPRTPAWSQASAPLAPSGASVAPVAPASLPAPASPPPSGRRAWPGSQAGPAQSVGSPQGDGYTGSVPVETGPARRSSPFGRGARPAPDPSSSAPVLGAPQPTRPPARSGWMPGRGGRTGSVPQVPVPADQPVEQTGARRPAWLGRTRSPSPTTSPVPAAPPTGTAPRLSAGPQSDPVPRGDAWRQIWGISPSDGSEEDR